MAIYAHLCSVADITLGRKADLPWFLCSLESIPYRPLGRRIREIRVISSRHIGRKAEKFGLFGLFVFVLFYRP